MDDRDREAIDGLFTRLAEVARNAPPSDSAAKALIADHLSRQPDASYFMAQTVIMQDMALKAQARDLEEAQRKLEALQRQGEARSGATSEQHAGGFLPNVGGTSDPWGRRPAAAPTQAMPRPMDVGAPALNPAYANPPAYASPPPPQPQFGTGGGFGSRFGGGGFLAGAAQAAVGVAGGVVLGNVLSNVFEGHGGGLFGNHSAATPDAVDLAAVPVEENVTINNYGAGEAGRESAQPSDPVMADTDAFSDGDLMTDASYDIPPQDDGWPQDSGDDFA